MYYINIMETRTCNDYNNYKDNIKCVLNNTINDDEIFEREIKILDKLNKFNKYHACYIRKTYNDNIYPDSQIYLNDENCELYDYSDASMAQLYDDIMKEMDELTELFNESAGNTNGISVSSLNKLKSENVEMKKDLEVKMDELKGNKGSHSYLTRKQLDGTIYASILWTTLATCLIYYTVTM